MYYTEEELLEAINILVEEYGFYEDEAIDMICEAYEMELLDEGKAYDVAQNILVKQYDNIEDASKSRAAYKHIKERAKNTDLTPEEYENMKKLRNHARKEYYKSATKAYAPIAVPYAVGTAGVLAYKAYKKNKRKKHEDPNAYNRHKVGRRYRRS